MGRRKDGRKREDWQPHHLALRNNPCIPMLGDLLAVVLNLETHSVLISSLFFMTFFISFQRNLVPTLPGTSIQL